MPLAVSPDEKGGMAAQTVCAGGGGIRFRRS